MIKTCDRDTPFATEFTNGKYTGAADAPKERGGGETSFNPHELLEASVASCFNIWLRKYAQEQNIPLEHITTSVTLDLQNAGETVFRYSLNLQGPLTEAQRQDLAQAVRSCPVHQTLGRKISFAITSA
jgi:putative redox protein